MTAGLHKLLPDFVGGVISMDDYQMTIWLPDGHHIGTGDYQMTARITDGHHTSMATSS